MRTVSKILNPISLTATAAIASVALLQSAPAQAVNLINNGNFETGDFTGWDVPITNTFTVVGISTANSTNVAFFSAFESLDTISQTIATTPGQTYQLSYDFLSDTGEPNPGGINEFQVNIINSNRTNTLFSQLNIPATPASTAYQFSFIGTGSDTIQFGGRHDYSAFELDNVVVTAANAATAVPEPFTVIGTFIGGTAALRMRKKLKSNK
jgi:hypothetical protein